MPWPNPAEWPKIPLLALAAALLIASMAVSSWRHVVPRREPRRRGAIVQDARRSRRGVAVRPDLVDVAGIAIAPRDESKHLKIIGATGTGKSTAIRRLMSAALSRGDRAIFADPDGGYQSCFHHRLRGDIVLNPFETSSVKWDLFAEIRGRGDAEQLAGALIPESADPAAGEWRGYARTLLAAVIGRCHAKGAHDCGNLWRLLMTAPIDELRTVVAGTPAQPFLEADNARMFGSIRSVMGSALAGMEYIQAQRSAPFSVRSWVGERRSPGALFVPYKAGQIQALRMLIAAWMHLAIFEAMSREEDRDQRLWFVIDELDALGRIHGLKDALARLRKFGGRCVLGFQSIAQVTSTYGQCDAQTLVENCGNTLILRCSGSESGGTSQFASRLIGEREVGRRQISRGNDRASPFSVRGTRRSRTVSDQFVTEAAVLASEIEQLQDLCGYLKTASSPKWLKVDFRNLGGPARPRPK